MVIVVSAKIRRLQVLFYLPVFSIPDRELTQHGRFSEDATGDAER